MSIWCSLEELLPKQKGCDDCFKDLAAMRRDAKMAGKEAVKFLANAEKDDDQFKKLHDDWLAAVGPFTGGSVRVGIFAWMTYVVQYQAVQGSSSSQDKLMKTEKEFETFMMGKGMTREWSLKEFRRRRSEGPAGGYKVDNDPDCGLPRVSCHGDTKESNFLLRQKVAEVCT